VKVTARSAPELQALCQLYYDAVDQLGDFDELDEIELPHPYRTLLAHDEHMTVALESYHGCPVAVYPLRSETTSTHYCRKTTLRRESDNAVVLFGIVRITRALLAAEIRAAIEGEKTPLGRILIQENVLRNVRLLSLWRVEPGEDLCRIFELKAPETLYGRTALIYCDSVPVIELLEIIRAG
jgi:chorismate-pyruvate lyase